MNKLQGLLTHLELTVERLNADNLSVEGLHSCRITMLLPDHTKLPVGQIYSIQALFSDIQFTCNAIMVSANPISKLVTLENTSAVEIKLKAIQSVP